MAIVQSQHLPPLDLPSDWAGARHLFEQATRGFKCSDLLHAHNPSCTAASLDMFKYCFRGSVTWFIPFYAVHVFWHRKKALRGDKKFYRELAYFYALSVIFGSLMGLTFSLTACLVVRQTRGFHFWTCVFVPGTLAGLSILVEHPYRRRIVMNSFYNMAMQYVYKRAQVSQLVRRTTTGETAVFMVINALLLYLLRKRRKTFSYWFYLPEIETEVSQSSHEGKCHVPHKGSCWKSAYQATMKYAGLAATLQAIRVLMQSGRKVALNPVQFLKEFVSWKTAAGVSSIGGYVFVYKVVRCAMARHTGSDKSQHSALAGLAAGATYWLQPNTTILTSAIIATIRLLHEYVPAHSKFLGQWPMPEIIFALCNGILFHARCMDMTNCPKFIIQMMDIATQNKSKAIYNAFLQQVMKFQGITR